MKLSVVMSTYNDAATLPASIDSVLSQDFRDFEFIIVNDGSPDPRTAEILDDYARRDGRIRVITKANEGLTKALIDGCAAAQGEYIARQDADDVSLPGRLARQADYLDLHPEVAFVSCASRVFGPRGEMLTTERRPSDPEEATRLLLHGRVGPPGHGSVMFRKAAYERVGGYRSTFYYAQDSDLWLRLGLVGLVGYLPDVLYAYEISPESISGACHAAKLPYADLVTACHELRMRGESDEQAIEEFRSRMTMVRVTPRADTSADAKAESRCRTSYFVGRCLLRRGDPRALGYFRECARLRPFFLPTWANMALSLVPLCRSALGCRCHLQTDTLRR